MLEQSIVLCCGFGVAPELGRAQDLALIVEQDQAMLLGRNAKAEDVLAVDVRRQQRTTGGEGECTQPLRGVLFATTVGAADQFMRGGTLAQHLAAERIEDDGFGALGAAVDAEE
ncbi:hypothetical protein D3C84_848580 [compost metagenome]